MVLLYSATVPSPYAIEKQQTVVRMPGKVESYENADGPPEGADGRVFVRREPRAELPREALVPCGQGDGRRSGEVGGLKIVLRRRGGG